MATPQEQRKIRLSNDYREMENIKGSIIQWRPLIGEGTNIEKYEITINVRSIIGPGPDYRGNHVIHLTLPSDYPFSPPQIVMQSSPQPYHPNWFSDKRWCYGSWDVSEGLGHHVIRMIRTLQFDREITNENSFANRDATGWYTGNLNRDWFPCDRQILPDPTKRRFEVKQNIKKTFSIQ